MTRFAKRHGFALTLTLLSSVTLWVLGSLAWQEAQERQVFALREIKLVGNQRASVEELLRYSELNAVGPQLQRLADESIITLEGGEDLLALNLDSLRSALLRHPWVKHVQLRRVWPKTLEVQIREYAPVAVVALGQLYYVDENGDIFSRVNVDEVPADWPIITGLSRELFETDRLEWNRQLLLARQFIDAAKRESLSVSDVQVDGVLGIIAHLSPAGTKARFGQGDFDSKVRRLKEVRTLLSGRGQMAETFYLDHTRHPERVVARLSKLDFGAKLDPKAPAFVGAR